MPVGTNGTSIYRPATAPPGTVCTGSGIGVTVRDAQGHVLFVMGLNDGKIYFGDQYSDPHLPTVQAATIVNGQMVVPPSGPTIVNIDGTDYILLSYEMANGQSQVINIRLSLYEDIRDGGLDGAIAVGLIAASFLDASTGLMPGMRDADHDGDIDLNDAQAVLRDMFLDEAARQLDQGDSVDSLAFQVLANSVPDAIGLLAIFADTTTGDQNEPSGGGGGSGGEGGGGGGDGDSGWIF
ncbi:putative membrane protein YgcG [Caulobacter ginsengisoli]|uniref:Membrane protein YgcG n=1 Tax=Caulobacter ginsengisoli TaxID=400775 RepID=A0ABU0IQH2_9CAUL|nr:hypothetical protein [Caulobacter ginsengisoli]MDQ0463591.1 putative membrane protein YgcG [Caulobacter ginsengisoli]